MTDANTSKLEPGQVAIPLVIDLSWARTDLTGVTCPFCGQVLDWGGLKIRGSDREFSEPNHCPHLEFASTECLPFDVNVSQIAESIAMLQESYVLFHEKFVDTVDFGDPFSKPTDPNETRAAERITELTHEIISNLNDQDYFVKPNGYYHQYRESVENELESAMKSIHEWMELSESSGDDLEADVDGLVEEWSINVSDSGAPRIARQRMRQEAEAHFREEVRQGHQTGLEDCAQNFGEDGTGLIDYTLLSNFNNFCHREFQPAVIAIFMAKMEMSNKCWCAIYSVTLIPPIEILEEVEAVQERGVDNLPF